MFRKTMAALSATIVALSAATADAGLFDRICSSDCDTCCDMISTEPVCCDSLCSDGCDTGCGCGAAFGGSSFKGFTLRKSDHCFDDFISPMSNFVHFEDPRTLTELRPVFVHHELPSQMGTLNIDGGEAQLLAAQFRIALTERLSLIAVKDGYFWAHNDGVLATLFDDGWADITAGLKYNWLRDVNSGSLISSGFTYEIPLGDEEALQSVADGEFHLFTSVAQRLLDGDAHYMTTFGWRLPVDGGTQTESLHWSNHIDVRMTNSLYLVSEWVWWHWIDDASGGLPLGVAGHDAFNLPATDVVGNDLLTQSVGFKYKPCGNYELGVAYEFPLTDFQDIIEKRIQVDMIFRY